PDIRAAATAQDLRALAKSFLTPNNAFLVLAGAIEPEAAEGTIREAFEQWKSGPDPWAPTRPTLPKPGVTRPTLAALADPDFPKGTASVEMRFRGPDTASPRSVQAEIWARLASDPASRISRAIAKQGATSGGFSEFKAVYRASRALSWLSASAIFPLSAKTNPAESAIAFKELVRGTEMYAMKSNPTYFPTKDIEAAKASIIEARSSRLVEPREATALLADEWILGGKSRILGREASLLSSSNKELAGLADEYFMKNLEVLIVRMNAQDMPAKRKALESYGFEILTPEKAFWWL
ncbi:MAG TPA: insulinase family protein, partial [Rectinemataceae bacterium]